MVETLTVLARSPPVPTRSTGLPETRIAADPASMPSASPATSATLSPLARSATANAAIWASVARSVMIWFIAQAAWREVREAPSSSVVRSRGQVKAVPVMSALSRRCSTGGHPPQR